VVGAADPAAALERIEGLLHGLRADLLGSGERARGHGSLVVEPDEDALLGGRRRILVLELLGAPLDEADDGAEPRGGFFDGLHVISITDDQVDCQSRGGFDRICRVPSIESVRRRVVPSSRRLGTIVAGG